MLTTLVAKEGECPRRLGSHNTKLIIFNSQNLSLDD